MFCNHMQSRASILGGGGMTHVASLKFQGEGKKSREFLYSTMQRSRSQGCVMTLGGMYAACGQEHNCNG
jgi:hypothetical protein